MNEHLGADIYERDGRIVVIPAHWTTDGWGFAGVPYGRVDSSVPDDELGALCLSALASSWVGFLFPRTGVRYLPVGEIQPANVGRAIREALGSSDAA